MSLQQEPHYLWSTLGFSWVGVTHRIAFSGTVKFQISSALDTDKTKEQQQTPNESPYPTRTQRALTVRMCVSDSCTEILLDSCPLSQLHCVLGTRVLLDLQQHDILLLLLEMLNRSASGFFRMERLGAKHPESRCRLQPADAPIGSSLVADVPRETPVARSVPVDNFKGSELSLGACLCLPHLGGVLSMGPYSSKDQNATSL